MSLFERTRQSAWLDAVTTPVDKEQVNSCLRKHLFEGVQKQKNRQKPLGSFLQRATNDTFSKFAQFFETAFRAALINGLIIE